MGLIRSYFCVQEAKDGGHDSSLQAVHSDADVIQCFVKGNAIFCNGLLSYVKDVVDPKHCGVSV